MKIKETEQGIWRIRGCKAVFEPKDKTGFLVGELKIPSFVASFREILDKVTEDWEGKLRAFKNAGYIQHECYVVIRVQEVDQGSMSVEDMFALLEDAREVFMDLSKEEHYA